MSHHVTAVYRQVIEDVIQEVREDFLAEGIDESVLLEMQQNWETKVLQSHALGLVMDSVGSTSTSHPTDYSNPSTGRNFQIPSSMRTSTSTTMTSQPSAPEYTSAKDVTTHLSSIPSSEHHHNRPDNQQDGKEENLTNSHGNFKRDLEDDSQLVNDEEEEEEQLTKTTRKLPTSMMSNERSDVYDNEESSIVDGGCDNRKSRPIRQSFRSFLADQARRRHLGEISSKTPNTSDYRMLQFVDGPAPPETHKFEDEGENGRNDAIGEEEDGEEFDEDDEGINDAIMKPAIISSNRNTSKRVKLESSTAVHEEEDEEEDHDHEQLDDIVLCQYEKVTRTKNKWRCVLKDGIMHIKGRDYIFGKAHGEFEW